MKLELTDYIKIAKSKGGDCLGLSKSSNKYKKYVWKCEKGHKWEAIPHNVLKGSWCPICCRTKKTIEDMKVLALQKEGECLSEVYIDARTSLTWKCNEGHIFEMVPTRVKEGRWCRICMNNKGAKIRRIPIEEIREIAKSRNGKCLSDTYDPNMKLKWECEFRHQWEANIHNVKSGSWCPICGHKRSGRKILTLEEMQEIAKSRGGTCLSKNYKNTGSKLKWMCDKGHIWTAIPSAIKKGSWCPTCQRKYWLNLEEMQKIAKERGGKCLSENYRNVNSKLKWQCAEGHTWLANYGNISIGRWCPVCSSSIGERICRAFFEQIFDKKFPKTRPPWLINQDGNQMELDGYCKELGLAFEHQGQQHYRNIDHFYSSDDQFQKRQADDDRKKILCEENNVVLIGIPQIPDLLPVFDVQQYILKQSRDNGIQISAGAETKIVKLRKAYSPSAKEKMKQIGKIASENGGVCLSQSYVGNNVKMRFRCVKGHEWETIPIVILKGHWCPKCATKRLGLNRRLTIDDMNQMAKERGGKCLSQTYVNANKHLLWECSQGHQWKAIPNSIKRGSWCNKCSNKNRSDRQKLTIEEMNNLAKGHGGKCISKTYINSKTKLLWECCNGHQWMTTPGSVISGNWCPKCAAEKRGLMRRLTIEEMRQIAKDRGGHCLSKTYINSGEKLLWECNIGHKWMATPDKIKQGSWCNICAKDLREKKKSDRS